MTIPPAEIQQDILNLIIQDLPLRAGPTVVNDSWDSPRRTLLACAGVCKAWHRYTLPYNFQSVTLHTTSQRRMDGWRSITKANPEISICVEDLELVVGVGEGPGTTIVDKKGESSLETMCGRLMELVNLTLISNAFCDRDYQDITPQPRLLHTVQRLCSMPKLRTLHTVHLKFPLSLLLTARCLRSLTLTTCNGLIFDFPSPSLEAESQDDEPLLPVLPGTMKIRGPSSSWEFWHRPQNYNWTSVLPYPALLRLTSKVEDFTIDLAFPTACDYLFQAANIVSLTLELPYGYYGIFWMPLTDRCRSFPWTSLTRLTTLKFAVDIDRPKCPDYHDLPGLLNDDVGIVHNFTQSLALANASPSLLTLSLQYTLKNVVVYEWEALEGIVRRIYTPAINNLLFHQFSSLATFHTVLDMGGTICPSVMGSDEEILDEFGLKAEFKLDEENRRNGGRLDEDIGHEIQVLVRELLPGIFGPLGRETSGKLSASVEAYWKHYPVWKETTYG